MAVLLSAWCSKPSVAPKSTPEVAIEDCPVTAEELAIHRRLWSVAVNLGASNKKLADGLFGIEHNNVARVVAQVDHVRAIRL